MANEKHLLVTVTGDYTDSALSAEAWQVGLRFILNFGAVDPVGTLPNSWDVVADSINRTETHWTIAGNWKCTQLGGTFQADDWLNDQVAPAFAAWLGAMPGVSDQCRLDWVKLYPIGTNGRAVPAPPYASGTPCLLTYTGSYPVGSNSSDPLPLQISEVVSHRTLQTGRAGRGRGRRGRAPVGPDR